MTFQMDIMCMACPFGLTVTTFLMCFTENTYGYPEDHVQKFMSQLHLLRSICCLFFEARSWKADSNSSHSSLFLSPATALRVDVIYYRIKSEFYFR